MDTAEKLGTHQKALSINLDRAVFGSFAEIGAGQEVARWFFSVGGASGTVAKTISAYDKEVSDDLYGAGTRYVSKPRLVAMLDNEWGQLLSQLHSSRGANTNFFSFVDTISARNFTGTNDCHGWVGLRFQRQANGPFNDVILHINLRDATALRQQDAVGILGVNLLYATLHALAGPAEFLASVFEELSLQRMEIDNVELNGPAFEKWDRQELHASLVTGGYAEAVVFPANNQFAPPNELLHKRSLVLAPGRFSVASQLYADLIRLTMEGLPAAELEEGKGGLGLFCLAAELGTTELEKSSTPAIVVLVNRLQKLGYGVMLFRSPELYTMSTFVDRYTECRIHFAIGLSIMVRVLEDRYKGLSGSLLEAMARLFSQNVRLVVHPMPTGELERWVKQEGLTLWTWEDTNGMVYADHLHPAKPLDYLYQYLLSEKWILPGKGVGRA